MTPQEIFNTAYTGIIAQGRQSLNKKGDCRYRGPDGLKCAIGHLIDDATAEKWEGIAISYINKFGTPPGWIAENIQLLRMIQDAHDADSEPETFIEEFTAWMEDIATQFNLEIPA